MRHKALFFGLILGFGLLHGLGPAPAQDKGDAGGTLYNRGSAPLDLDGILRGRTTRPGPASSRTSGKTYDDPLKAYRARRNQEARAAQQEEQARMARLSQQRGTVETNATATPADNATPALYNRNAGQSNPQTRTIYRQKDRTGLSKPKKVFNSVD